MNMKDAVFFAEMPIPNFLDIIQEGGARADEAMYENKSSLKETR